MLRRLWLLFAQATTVGLAALFIVATLRPEWLRGAPPVVSTPVSGNVSIQQVALSDSGDRPESQSGARGTGEALGTVSGDRRHCVAGRASAGKRRDLGVIIGDKEHAER